MNKVYNCFFKGMVASMLFFTTLTTNAQNTNQGDTANYPYWIDMMQDTDANFYEVQSAFNKFFENRDFSEGWGYKVYLRWEYEWSQKIDAQGNLPKADETFNSYQNYINRAARFKRGPNGSNWTEVGPIFLPVNGTGQPNGLGRVNEVCFHPEDSNVIYAGAPAGGLWKTTDGGLTWESNTDDMPTLGVSAMVIDYSDPTIMYIGSGDRDGSNSTGMGVFKSTDGGVTWAPSNTGMGNKTVSRLIMHPNDPKIIYAATNSGIYKTFDGGEDWERVSQVTSNFKDIVFKPNNPEVIYGSSGRVVYRSVDSGQNFLPMTEGLPNSGVRIALAVTPDEPNNLYVLLSNQRTFKGFYLSTDSGENFVGQSTTPNILGYDRNGNDTKGQAWYDLDIAVEPGDASIVYVGGINLWKSVDFGKTWTISAHWTYNGGAGVDDVHADQHILEFSPHNGNLYVGNDGGVFKTADQGVTYDDLSSGLAISQIYKIGQSANARGLVIAGFQDNGTAIYRNGTWFTEIGGDGMECTYSPSDSNLVFGELYYGDIRRSRNGGLGFGNFAGLNKNGMTESGGWVTPYIIAEDDNNTMYVGMKNVWRSNNINGGNSNEIGWEKISDGQGGANVNITILEHSPADPNVLFMAKSDNKLYRTTNASDGTPTWKEFDMPVTRANDIEAHHTNKDIVYMVGSKKVYKSVDQGQLWTEMTGSLPNVNMFCIIIDTSTDEGLYVSTDAGVYFYNESLGDWIPYLTGLPVNCDVRELDIYYDAADPSRNVIRAATYGRGLWESPLFGSSMATFTYLPNENCKHDTVTFVADPTGATQWDWTFEAGDPATANTETVKVVFTDPGDMKVTLIAGDGSKSDTIEKTLTICNPVGVKTNSFDTKLSLYPNPANESFTIALDGNTLPIKIEMYNANGQRVRQIYSAPTESVAVRTNEMSEGIYLVKVYTGTEIRTGRIVLMK